jgi:endothelin-converting enzyme/putative endopeptidase
MYEENLRLLRSILEEASRATNRDIVTQEIGDFYAACENEPAINHSGIAALQPELKLISEVRHKQDLAPLVARLQLEFSGNPIVFGFGSRTDYDDSTRKIAGISQGGIGLPDRDYYTKDDPRSKGDPQALSSARAESLYADGGAAQVGKRRCGNRDAYRSGTRPGITDTSRAPRSLQVEAQNDSW